MKYRFIFFILIGFGLSSYGQVGNVLQRRAGGTYQNGQYVVNDSTSNKMIKVKISGKTTYKDYKIISYDNDTSYVDTTLTIRKDYKHNFTLKDNFELLPFANMGQTFTRLGYNFNDVDKYPILGATAKRFDYYTVKDIQYYRVATPTSIFTHETGFMQGQMLNSLLTMNLNPRLNISMEYKGLRSLGFYRNQLASQGHVTFTMHYKTKNNKYSIRAHMENQDLMNEENGGLVSSDLYYFETNNPQFTQRSRLDVNLSNASSMLRTNRYYVEQGYKLWQRQDSVSKKTSYLQFGHILNYELSHYEFNQSYLSSEIFGTATGTIADKLVLSKRFNQLFVKLKSPLTLGDMSFRLENYNYNYGYTNDTTVTTITYGNQLKGSTVAVGAHWNAQLKRFYLKADASNILTGPLNGNRLKADAILKKDSVYNLTVGVMIASKSPNFNFQLYRSAYDAYNWENHFSNERFKNIHGSIVLDKFGTIEGQFTNISNYTYFGLPDATTGQPKPEQSQSKVSYFKIKLNKSFKFGKFALDNTLMFNNVSSGSDVFRVPTWVTRNSFYLSTFMFKGHPLYLQTGITFRYFKAFYANNFNPILNEFSLQNDTKIGNYPILDFFFNAQIQRTRIFFKVEHFNSGFSGYNYYTAPNYPYRDLSIRFGIVWNFFI